MANIKVTAAQIIALRSATMRDNGSYELTTAKGQTVNALTRVGILVSGTRFLTVQGVSVMHAVSDVSVIASKGHTSYVSNSPESLEMFTLPERESESVEIQGEEPNNWAPDFSAQGASECYFGCGASPVVVFVSHVGVTEGLCEAHRDRVEGATYELPTVTPEERQTDAESVVEGDQEEPFVFVPGTHALDMGDKGYNRFCGIGESMGVPGSLYAFGLSVAISRHPGMNGTGQNNIPCEFGDVITVRTSIGDKRYVVSDNRYSATGPRKGDPILTPYALDDVRCTRCETHGDNSMIGKNIGGDWVCGYCVENTDNASDGGFVTATVTDPINNRVIISNGQFPADWDDAMIKMAVAIDHTGNSKNGFAYVVTRESDDGFVETDSTDDYSAVAALSTGAGFHTVKEETTSTGTTHHTMDTHGGQWTRFEHVLSVGDIVRSTESGRTLYEVYALIPGLPVVYVDPCDGREPFPMGATTLYAL